MRKSHGKFSNQIIWLRNFLEINKHFCFWEKKKSYQQQSNWLTLCAVIQSLIHSIWVESYFQRIFNVWALHTRSTDEILNWKPFYHEYETKIWYTVLCRPNWIVEMALQNKLLRIFCGICTFGLKLFDREKHKQGKKSHTDVRRNGRYIISKSAKKIDNLSLMLWMRALNWFLSLCRRSN